MGATQRIYILTAEKGTPPPPRHHKFTCITRDVTIYRPRAISFSNAQRFNNLTHQILLKLSGKVHRTHFFNQTEQLKAVFVQQLCNSKQLTK